MLSAEARSELEELRELYEEPEAQILLSRVLEDETETDSRVEEIKAALASIFGLPS